MTGRGPEAAYKNVKLPGNKFISFLLFGIVLAIGSYFVVWIGWILRYVYSSFTDGSLVQSSTNSATYFDTKIAANPMLQMVFSALVIALVSITILGGKERIQKVSSVIVPIFYTMILVMTILVLIQPGVFSSTFTYLTSFDIGAVTAYTFVTALGQAFFSLCLGGTFMVLYGSYLERRITTFH